MFEAKPNIMKGIFNIADDLTKERALDLCSSHLQGNWASVTEDDIHLNPIDAGFMNRHSDKSFYIN